MAGLLEIKDLEARKRALAAESDVYRETLKLEVQNIRLYSVQTKRKFTRFGSNPLLMWAAPVIGSFLTTWRRKRQSPWRRFVPFTLMAVPLLKKLLPLLAVRLAASLWQRRLRRGEESTPAAMI